MQDYKDYKMTLTSEDGQEVDYLVVDRMDHDGKSYLLIAPEEQVNNDSAEYEILFVDISAKTENDESTWNVITDPDEYENLFQAYEEIREDVDFDEDDDEGEFYTFTAEDENGDERAFLIWTTFIYDGRKFHLCIPADSMEDTVSEMAFFEVVDFEDEEPTPEYEKDWELVEDEDLLENISEYLRDFIEEDDEEEDEE